MRSHRPWQGSDTEATLPFPREAVVTVLLPGTPKGRLTRLGHGLELGPGQGKPLPGGV